MITGSSASIEVVPWFVRKCPRDRCLIQCRPALLAGRIPPELGLLENLESLNLGENDLKGELCTLGLRRKAADPIRQPVTRGGCMRWGAILGAVP